MKLKAGDEPPPRMGYQVFISFGGEDAALAEQVYRCLSRHAPVFFYKETEHSADFLAAINGALETAHSLVTVGTKLEHLMRGFPRFERESFFQDMMFGRKPPDRAKLVTVVEGLEPYDLPLPLRKYQVIKWGEGACDRLEGILFGGQGGGRGGP